MNQSTLFADVRPDIMASVIDIGLRGSNTATTEEVIRFLGSSDLPSRTRDRIWGMDPVDKQGVSAVRVRFKEPYDPCIELDLLVALDRFEQERTH